MTSVRRAARERSSRLALLRRSRAQPLPAAHDRAPRRAFPRMRWGSCARCGPAARRGRAGPQADLGHRDQLRAADRRRPDHARGSDLGAAATANVARTYLLGAANRLARIFWYRYDMGIPRRRRRDPGQHPARRSDRPDRGRAGGRGVRAGPELDARPPDRDEGTPDLAPATPRHLHLRGHSTGRPRGGSTGTPSRGEGPARCQRTQGTVASPAPSTGSGVAPGSRSTTRR